MKVVLGLVTALFAGLDAATCYTDSDCERSQFCNDGGSCENNDVICYGDDE